MNQSSSEDVTQTEQISSASSGTDFKVTIGSDGTGTASTNKYTTFGVTVSLNGQISSAVDSDGTAIDVTKYQFSGTVSDNDKDSFSFGPVPGLQDIGSHKMKTNLTSSTKFTISLSASPALKQGTVVTVHVTYSY